MAGQLAPQVANSAHDESQPALSIYRKLIDSRGIPDELLTRLLSEGSRLAWTAGEVSLAMDWTNRTLESNLSPAP